MPKSTTLETTTTWVCDFCRLQDIHISTGKEPAPVLPEGWSTVLIVPGGGVQIREEHRKPYINGSPKEYYICSQIPFTEYLACPICGKNFRSIVERPKAKPKPEPPPPPPPPPPNVLGRVLHAFRTPK